MGQKTIIALAAMLMATAAVAQTSPHSGPPEQFKFMAARDVAALTAQPGRGAHTAYLGDHENYYVEYANRSDAGNLAEVHAHWTHYVNILSGEATLTYGGTVVNPKDTGPGQIRGSGITGGKSISVHAGDFIQIPAGLPHMFNPPKGGTFHYVVFNTRQ